MSAVTSIMKINSNKAKKIFHDSGVLAIWPLALVIGFIFYLSSRVGLGLSPDSIGYIKAAQGLIDYGDIRYFSSEWPPLFPMILAMLGYLFQNDAIFASRILQSLLVLINIVACFYLLRLAMPRSSWWIPILSIVICTQDPITFVSYYVWSETLFITLINLNLLCLAKLCQSSCSKNIFIRYFIFLVIITSLALFTRFIGYSLAIANSLILIYIYRYHWIQLIILIGVQLLVPILTFLPWLVYRSSFESENTAIALTLPSINNQALLRVFEIIGAWILPMSQNFSFFTVKLSGAVGVISLLMSIIYISLFFLKKKSTQHIGAGYPTVKSVVLFIIIIFVMTYVISYFALTSVITYPFMPDQRYMAPIAIPVFLGMSIAIAHVATLQIRYVLCIFVVFWAVDGYQHWRTRFLVTYYDGVELNSNTHRESALQNYAKSCDRSAIVYSDQPWEFDLIFLDKVRWLPRPIFHGSGKVNFNYYKEIIEVTRIADIIIIQNSTSSAAQIIDIDPNFIQLSVGQARVWLRMKPGAQLCR